MSAYQFEVCANSVESCLAAQRGGADRVELCAGIPEGGTTPSYGDIAIAKEALFLARQDNPTLPDTKLHVIIRPRGGDFLYSPLEERIMLTDIENAHKLGVDGIALGCLTQHGEIDVVKMAWLIAAAGDLSVTLHRAFDVCRNPQQALKDAITLGCNRILTSGQATTAEQGIPLLKELNETAAGHITLMAGCGVNETNIHRIAQETGIREFHFSARERIESRMSFRNEQVAMGGTVQIEEYARSRTSAESVRRTIAVLR